MNAVSAYRSELRAAAARGVRARRRRTIISLALALVGVVTASLAIAATSGGWLTGEPAPRNVVEGFRQYTPQLGFRPQAGKAQFVAQDGPIKLYATANREGGICYLVDEPWKPANAGDGGTCASREKAAVPISAGLLGGSADLWVVGGRIGEARARSVTFATPTGDPVSRPLGAGGYYVAQIQWAGQCPKTDWSPKFVALDGGGNTVATAEIQLMHTSYDRNGRMIGCGGSVTPTGPEGGAPRAQAVETSAQFRAKGHLAGRGRRR